jgi:hypothetical protein
MAETATTDGALIVQPTGVKVEVMEGNTMVETIEVYSRAAIILLRWWMGGCR